VSSAEHGALQCVAVCCSVLQCVAVCCSVLQFGAMCCSSGRRSFRRLYLEVRGSVLRCVAVC